jgi:DNA-3-methyladenine glycosylase
MSTSPQKILPRAFYERPTLEVAKSLLGKVFTHRTDDCQLSGYIVEVEAYHQDGDSASHSYHGRTSRNDIMFGPAGHLYVYFIYGMHYCMNVVTEEEGIGAAILIRAVEPVSGIDEMHLNRGSNKNLQELTSGPAKSCQAFGISGVHNGFSLINSEIYILDSDALPDSAITASERIGIQKSAELPWRFTVWDNYFLSRNAGKQKLAKAEHKYFE